MATETLAEGLEHYRIGVKVRALRTAKGLGLAQLGHHTGLSAGMLSKIERGSVFPTLPTLLRIAMVFGVGLDHFFAEDDRPRLAVVRRKDRLRLPNTTGGRPSYFFESLDYPVNQRPIEAYLTEFLPGTPPSDPHSHAGFEVIYLISGSVEIRIHNKAHVLEAGDAMHFDAGFPHSYQGKGQDRSTAVVVVTVATG